MKTIKEAILQTLEDEKRAMVYSEVYNHILAKNYYLFSKESNTPEASISAQLSEFIRLGDSRVKRIKNSSGIFAYYFSKYENEIGLEKNISEETKSGKKQSFDERDLHILLSSYLNSVEIFSKTIFHERSANIKDSHQKWVHPDLVGVSLSNLRTSAAKNLMRSINKLEAIRIHSYELKKEINSDYELKHAFFQAVSNSSWANFGYLVTFQINDNLVDELERLCQSFGIGVIILRSYPYESKILFQPKFKELDFSTIDKLCSLNKEFKKFIELTENILSAEEKYQQATQNELIEFCDDCFTDEKKIKEYCDQKNIPFLSEEDRSSLLA